jgi:hypothetical protein
MLQPTTWYPKDFYLLKIIWTIAKYIDLMNAYLTPLLVIVILFLEGLVPGQNIDMWSTIFLRFFDYIYIFYLDTTPLQRGQPPSG